MAEQKTLFVSDFDDTLARTDAKVFVVRNGKSFSLTPEEYAVFEEQPGDKFDFSEFEQLKNPRPIARFVKLLKQAVDNKKAHKVAILTARGHTGPVKQFLNMIGITKGVVIAALGDSNPQRKANYIEKQIKDGYNRIAFIDDSPKNVEAVKGLKSKYPNVKLLVHQAKEPEAPAQESGKKNVEVKPIKKGDSDFAQADEWIRKQHYLKKWPKSVQSTLGVYIDGKLSGVLVYGIGTRGQAATDIFGPGVMANNQLWELQRAFTTDEAKKIVPNLGSMVISRGNEYIRTSAKTKDGKPIKAIVSYADSAQGHKGSVYQSTNATYLGEQPPRTGWAITDPKTGDTVTRSVIKPSILKRMADEGYIVQKVTPDTGKHKFLYALGKDQNEKDQLLSLVQKPIFDYPKAGEKPKQIENPAKQRMAAKKPQVKQQPQKQSKQATIKQLLRSKVTNPDTGEKILVQTALKKDKTHPSYKQAMGMVNAYAKRFGIRLKQR